MAKTISITDNPRLPRPLGSTIQSIHYRKQTNEELRTKLKEKLIANVIEQYTANMQTLNGRQLSIDDLALFLGISHLEVMRLMNKSLQRMNQFFENQAGEGTFARVLYLGLLKGAQEAQSEAQSQVAILKASQGGQYKAFVSGEVNRAITNLINSTKPTLDILKALQERQPNNIFLSNPAQNNTQNNIYITTTEASKMITEKAIPTLLTDGSMLEDLGDRLKGLPDVNAKSQDLTSIGIKYTGPESLSQFQASEEAKKI